MKIWNKIKFQTAGKVVKKYQFCGVTLLRKEKTPFKKKINLLGLKIAYRRPNASPIILPPRRDDYHSLKSGIISIDKIKQIIDSPQVKVVSFDIFDTLLIRPVINPSDIFYLIDAKLKKLYGLDFLQYRQNAEAKMQNRQANFDEIYDFIQHQYNLSAEDIALMKKAELEAESQLITIRSDIYELYEYAVSAGKKIIAVSDMYLSSDFLLKLLHNKGYSALSEVYVSNAYKARKDDGDLFEIVKAQEKAEIIHIGDNYKSDYLSAIEHGITAIYYPSVKNAILSGQSVYHDVWNQAVSSCPFTRILLGFTLNYSFGNLSKVVDGYKVFADFSSFVKLSIAPLIFYISNRIANDEKIQNSYQQILFASRDGYLPQIGYDILAQYRRLLPSQYIYAGRRAYFSYLKGSFQDYVEDLKVNSAEAYTISSLLDTYIHDKKLRNYILSHISRTEAKLDLSKHKKAIIDVLNRFDKQLADYYRLCRFETAGYYNQMLSHHNREVVFDCGYSGSISNALTQIIHKPVDKIYLWQTSKNRRLDSKNQTVTYELMQEEQPFIGCNIIYEEIFSPLAGGCLGFKDGQPILENIEFSPSMRQKYQDIKDIVTDFMHQIANLFGDYLPYLNISDSRALQDLLTFAITRSPYNELLLFEDIKFPDTVCYANTATLTTKIEDIQSYADVYDRTGFANPLHKLIPCSHLQNNHLKIGVHCHLYNVYLYQELLDYLKDFPQSFDLILTICKPQYRSMLQNIFSSATIANLHRLEILTVKNRGRDVAPWLVSTQKLQDKYDIFCHIHGKESSHIGFGNEWRRYLFDNLISKDSVVDIINSFVDNPQLGCVFPAPYANLKQMVINNNIDQMGMFGEDKMIAQIVSQMGSKRDFGRNEMYFSEGTMMWYRPQAMKKLFDIGLKYTDFPPEPIGVGGTIAHAIERLPAFVTNISGYEAMMYNRVG